MHRFLAKVAARTPDMPGRKLLRRMGVPKELRRMVLFWEVSVSAWLIDAGLLALLVYVGVPVFVAACLSPLPALLWNFTVSTYKVYFRDKGFSRRRFGIYVLFNLTMMVVWAGVINWGHGLGVAPLVMKCVITPATFLINFMFTSRLLKSGGATQRV